MSDDYKGGLNYALLKRHYDCDDYVSLVVNGVTLLNGIPFFSAFQDYYTIGLMAYLNDINVIDLDRGWCQFTHNEPNAPRFLQAFLAALGITTWPIVVPAFEAKDILFYATEDCWVRFEGDSRVRHFIPADENVRYHRRCFKFYVQGVTADGVLRVRIEG